MKINNDNYFSTEIKKTYLDVSTFKDFVGFPAKEGCEYRALKRVNGEFEEPKSEALLLGSLVDEMLLGTEESIEKFKSENPELYSTRGATKGMLKSAYTKAYDMVDRAKKDKKFMSYLEGEHQKIMTGTLFGVDWRIKIDNYIENKAIVDLKTTASIRESHYAPDFGRRVSIFEWYDYLLQAAIYQEVVFQNTGNRLPFFFACVSKENPVDIELIWVDNQTLHERIYGNEFSEGIADQVDVVSKIIKGEISPRKCGCCSLCVTEKKIEKPINWLELGGDI